MNVTEIISVVGALTSVLAAFASRRMTLAQVRREEAASEKEEADAADKIKAAALDLLEPYRRRVEVLAGEVKELKKEVTRLEDKNAKLTLDVRRLEERSRRLAEGVRQLTKQVVGLGQKPVFDISELEGDI